MHMAQGKRSVWLMCAVLLWFAACGKSTAALAVITPDQSNAAMVELADLPTGFRLVQDATPSNGELAALLNLSGGQRDLDQLGRRGGAYRTFAYTLPEPTTINGITSATIEIDCFGDAAAAQQWFDLRQSTLANQGPLLDAPAPGSSHAIHAQTYRAGDIAATTSAVAFQERNVVVEIATTFVGQGVSIAEATRFADLIDDRLIHPVSP